MQSRDTAASLPAGEDDVDRATLNLGEGVGNGMPPRGTRRRRRHIPPLQIEFNRGVPRRGVDHEPRHDKWRQPPWPLSVERRQSALRL